MTTWIRLSDRIGEHPKTMQVPRAHRWALVDLLGYCSRNLTDGFIPAEMVRRLIDQDELESLCFAGFLHKSPGGYTIHDYLEWQTPRESIERRRAAGRLGGLKSRPPKREAIAKAGASRLLQHPAEPDTDTYTDTRSTKDMSAASADVSDFDEFYDAYPRKIGKRKAHAAYRSAIKRTTADTIIAAACQLRDDPNLPDKQFIPHPATWLNRDGWNDEPPPPKETKASGALMFATAANDLNALETG